MITSMKCIGFSANINALNIVAIVTSIRGSVGKLGVAYSGAKIILYNKANLQPIAITRPNKNGNYKFLGLSSDLRTFIVAFDQRQEFNAVIQDNVVPK